MIDLLNFIAALVYAAINSPWSWALGAGVFLFGYSWSTKTDNVTTVQAADVNNLQTEKLDRDGAIAMTGAGQFLLKDIYVNCATNTDLAAVATACYGQIYTNVGASGAIEIELPAAVVGMSIIVRVSVAQTIKLDPNGTDQIDILTDTAGDYLISDNVIGSFIQLKCGVANHWTMWGMNGSWTEE